MEKQVQKKDFVEIEFTGLANDQVFDTTDKEKAKKMGIEADIKPLIICVGYEMLLKGFDESLIGMEIGKDYSIVLSPKKAFGERVPSLIKIIPLNVFKDKKLNPYPGMTVQLDNYIAKILSVTGGRVTVDFNNPLAGKEINYKFKILRKINNDKEKINSLQDYFFKQRFEFELKDKKVIFREEKTNALIDIFKNKFKEMTDMDFEIEKKDEKEEGKK